MNKKVTMIVAGILSVLMLTVCKLYFGNVTTGIFSKEVFCGMVIAGVWLVLMVAVYKLRNKEKPVRLCRLIVWSVLPAVTFGMVETINGSIGTLQTTNIVKNLILYYLVYFALNFIVGNSKVATMIYLPVFAVFGLVEYFVMLFRGRPFVLQDITSFRTAMSVAGTYVFSISLVVMLSLSGVILLLWLVLNWYKGKVVKRRINFGLLAAMGVLVAIQTRGDNTFFNELNMWDLSASYDSDGVILALLEGIRYSYQEKPDNYSAQMVEEIASGVYREEVTSDRKPNIILIMNESFADLDYINEIATDEELLAFLKELSYGENVVSGYLNMPVFGAGTSNSEYEVLVGNSVKFLPFETVAYQMNVSEKEAGMASILKAQDYVTIALHPYQAANWNRENVYKNMSFDEFFHELNWGSTLEIVRWCASDLSVYEKLVELCENVEEPLFAFAVTMQNHGGYDIEGYDSTVELYYDSDYPQAKQYLTLLQESDRAFEWLVEAFSEVEEDTLIIMFGDHQPALETAFYEELFGKSLSEMTAQEKQSRYVTPFIIWANYDIEEEYEVQMSSNYFGSYILELAGAELTVYNRFLLNLMEEIPIIGMGGILDAEGNWYDWELWPEEYEELLNQYKILQYNKVYDKVNYRADIFEISAGE